MLTDKQLEEIRVRLIHTWDEVAGMELSEEARNKLGAVKNDTLALWLCTSQVIREHSDLRKALYTLTRELTIQMEEYGIITQEDTDGIKGNPPTEEQREPDLQGYAEQILSNE